jgi:hypothetical protein
MSSATDRSKLGKTQRVTAETKADTTKRVSLEITQNEAEQRRYKTEKLKAARLARQASEDDPKSTDTQKDRVKRNSETKS